MSARLLLSPTASSQSPPGRTAPPPERRPAGRLRLRRRRPIGRARPAPADGAWDPAPPGSRTTRRRQQRRQRWRTGLPIEPKTGPLDASWRDPRPRPDVRQVPEVRRGPGGRQCRALRVQPQPEPGSVPCGAGAVGKGTKALPRLLCGTYPRSRPDVSFARASLDVVSRLSGEMGPQP